jgi:hypothetical protein
LDLHEWLQCYPDDPFLTGLWRCSRCGSCVSAPGEREEGGPPSPSLRVHASLEWDYGAAAYVPVDDGLSCGEFAVRQVMQS